jgi:hypothetical protein
LSNFCSAGTVPASPGPKPLFGRYCISDPARDRLLIAWTKGLQDLRLRLPGLKVTSVDFFTRDNEKRRGLALLEDLLIFVQTHFMSPFRHDALGPCTSENFPYTIFEEEIHRYDCERVLRSDARPSTRFSASLDLRTAMDASACGAALKQDGDDEHGLIPRGSEGSVARMAAIW